MRLVPRTPGDRGEALVTVGKRRDLGSCRPVAGTHFQIDAYIAPFGLSIRVTEAERA